MIGGMIRVQPFIYAMIKINSNIMKLLPKDMKY